MDGCWLTVARRKLVMGNSVNESERCGRTVAWEASAPDGTIVGRACDRHRDRLADQTPDGFEITKVER